VEQGRVTETTYNWAGVALIFCPRNVGRGGGSGDWMAPGRSAFVARCEAECLIILLGYMDREHSVPGLRGAPFEYVVDAMCAAFLLPNSEIPSSRDLLCLNVARTNVFHQNLFTGHARVCA
jgi:hypothetical protein